MIHRIESVDDPRVAVYARLTEAELRNRLNPEDGVFIAESPKVIRTALEAGIKPLSMLCEDRHIKGDAADIIARCPEMDVFTGERKVLASLTGYTLTRGVLCAMRRPKERDVAEVVGIGRRVAVIDGVSDATNIGVIFRSAAALGIDAVLVTPTSCDPLNRRSVRVSMGAVFLIPWTYITNPQTELNSLGIRTAAMALTRESVPITDTLLRAEPRLAIMLGEEGYGLSRETIAAADYTVLIPMHHGVDSLNVGSAAAIAFWELARH